MALSGVEAAWIWSIQRQYMDFTSAASAKVTTGAKAIAQICWPDRRTRKARSRLPLAAASTR